MDEFAGGADQFDDITMLCIEMKSSDMKKINLAPTLEQLPQATDFFEGILAEAGAPMKAIAQVNVAVDEIFSNIARYSGATGVVLGCSLKDGKATLRFSDNGRPYDPTEKPDPDTTQSAEEREVGGLGIFMVKKLMDEGKTVDEIGKQLGMKPEEIFRLSGFTKDEFLNMMTKDHPTYSKAKVIRSI